jgi:hypothetical protein
MASRLTVHAIAEIAVGDFGGSRSRPQRDVVLPGDFGGHGPRPPGVGFVFHGPIEPLAHPRWQPEADLSVVHADGLGAIFQAR